MNTIETLEALTSDSNRSTPPDNGVKDKMLCGMLL